MQCKKIQELLKTDYLDGEIDQEQLKFIQQHLAQCPQCRVLESELQNQRRTFKQAKQQQVPERVWQNIRDAIIRQNLNQESDSKIGVLEQLKHFLFAPKPAFALASIIVALIVTLTFFGTATMRNQVSNTENNIESLLTYGLNSESTDLTYDFGTNLEEYFL
jgi:predicted anti-sigma-YlaC factor YlaD